MNPYDFVPVDLADPPQRRPYVAHDRFSGITGRMRCRLTTLTPIFIPEYRSQFNQSNALKHFLKNAAGQAIIPGSSLKGLFRNLVETVGGGCWLLFGDGNGKYKDIDHESKLNQAFHRCHDLNQLCPSCRIFGLVNGNKCSYLGNVSFSDAVCAEAISYRPIYTIILGEPKPHHVSWYLDADQQTVAGRKFYYHQNKIDTLRGYQPANKPMNQYIEPLDQGNEFEFEVFLSNIAEDDLALLLYAINLEPTMRHKLGYGKPAGLGSVLIEPLKLELHDLEARYRGRSGRRIFTGEELVGYLEERTAAYLNNRTSPVLQALRRIWQWPPLDVDFSYPTNQWFHDKPLVTMADFNRQNEG